MPIVEIGVSQCAHLNRNFMPNEMRYFQFSSICHHFPLKSQNRHFLLFELDSQASAYEYIFQGGSQDFSKGGLMNTRGGAVIFLITFLLRLSESVVDLGLKKLVY